MKKITSLFLVFILLISLAPQRETLAAFFPSTIQNLSNGWLDDTNNGFIVRTDSINSLIPDPAGIYLDSVSIGPESFTIMAGEDFAGKTFDLKSLTIETFHPEIVGTITIKGFDKNGIKVGEGAITTVNDPQKVYSATFENMANINSFEITIKGLDGAPNGDWVQNFTIQSFTIGFPSLDQEAPKGLLGMAPSKSGNDGKITGTLPDMEYRIKDSLSWQKVIGSEITGLSSGLYDVRYSAKPGYNASPSVEVEVPPYQPPLDQLAPDGLIGVATTFAGNDGKITGTTSAMEYRMKESVEWFPATETEITGLSAGTYEVRYAAKPGYNPGAATEVIVPPYTPLDQTAPIGLKGIAPTVTGNNGKITGASSDMEFKAKGSLTWLPVTGSEIPGLTAGTYEVRYAAKPGYNASPFVEVEVSPYLPPLDQDAPVGLMGIAPSMIENDGKIIGTTVSMEYKLKENSEWVSATEAEIVGLFAGIYEVRYAAKPGYNPGSIAEVVVPPYTPLNQQAPAGLAGVAPTVSGNNGKITGSSSAMEYKVKGSLTWLPVTGSEISGLSAATYEVRYAAKPGYNASPLVEVEVPPYLPPLDQAAPIELAGVATTFAGNDGKIIGTTSAMEYREKGSVVWIPATETEIVSLSAGIYELRYTAKPGYNAGATAEVEVPAYTPLDQAAPTGLVGVAPTVSGNDGKIIGTTSAMEYRLKETAVWVPVLGTEIDGLYAGIYEIRYTSKLGYNAGALAEVEVPAYIPMDQAAPNGLRGAAPTAAGNNGKITGTTIAMEYRLKSHSTWQPVLGTEILGLSAGTYEVRYTAKPGYKESPVVEVVVPRYVAPTPSNPDPEPSSPVRNIREGDVGIGEGETTGTVAKVEIERTLDNNRKIDQVILSDSIAQNAVSKAMDQGKDNVSIIISDLPNDLADEVSVKVPKQSLTQLSKSSLSLELQTEDVSVQLPKGSVQGLNNLENDLFFRVVPIRKDSEKQEIFEKTQNTKLIRDLANNGKVEMLGKPMTIETNYKNQNTLVTFSLKDIGIPAETLNRDEFLKSLAVFIQHSDGEQAIQKGIIKYDSKGNPIGIQIQISKFSTFTIIGLPNSQPKKEFGEFYGVGAGLYVRKTNTFKYETPSKIKLERVRKGEKVLWGKTQLKTGQLGKVTITANTVIYKLEGGKFIPQTRILKKGEEYRVYSYSKRELME
ncbi:hypothetical protein [Bacillus infantis]|uniref:hypothetical protein n=1 Tax=Bacillus infantis TaxID=324767 RepID=UPI00209DA357|nr:hypothetical protein [Bacillus infantis]MCP1161304.1 hypothetical protein [Bacillus infantis]